MWKRVFWQAIRQWPLGDRDSMEFSESRYKHQIDKIKSKEISFLTTMCIRQKTISIQSVCKNFSQSRGYCQGVQREPTHILATQQYSNTRGCVVLLVLFVLVFFSYFSIKRWWRKPSSHTIFTTSSISKCYVEFSKRFNDEIM